uniref:Uncharacterized protein n=1 Tax=Peronospora matthiolae TaxID=2874970 RepID=A0AAV1T849_9STRA
MQVRGFRNLHCTIKAHDNSLLSIRLRLYHLIAVLLKCRECDGATSDDTSVVAEDLDATNGLAADVGSGKKKKKKVRSVEVRRTVFRPVVSSDRLLKTTQTLNNTLYPTIDKVGSRETRR